MMALGGWALLSEPRDEGERLVGWAVVLLFGGGAVVLVLQGIRSWGQPLLSVGPMGMRVRLVSLLARKQELFVPWEEIAAVEFRRARIRAQFRYEAARLAIVLKDPEGFVTRAGIQGAGQRLFSGILSGRLWVEFHFVARPNRKGRELLEAIRRYPAASHVELEESD